MRNDLNVRPYVIKPAPDVEPCFSMTRFAPVTDDFFFSDDYLVILSPFDVVWEAPVYARSLKSLEDHIRYIQENQIEKACVIAKDIFFLRRCPSLKSLRVIVPYSVTDFDYSPLYDLPELVELNCQTVYGPKDDHAAVIDYSRFPNLQYLTVNGAKGHHNLASVKGLRKINMGQGQPVSKSLADLDFSKLEELHLCQSTIRSLQGLERLNHIRKVSVSYCRSLEDLSVLADVGDSLTSLEIDGCGKIKDFTWLEKLTNLENLVLFGSNILPNLNFLKGMKALKSIRFTMNVLDGDLSLCKNIHYAFCKNRKHYNLKNEDLPKGNG